MNKTDGKKKLSCIAYLSAKDQPAEWIEYVERKQLNYIKDYARAHNIEIKGIVHRGELGPYEANRQFELMVKRIENRETTTEQLKALGFSCTDSMANFIFASHNRIPAAQIAAELRKRKILVRYFNKAKIDNYLRITVGSAEEMQALVDAIKEITA